MKWVSHVAIAAAITAVFNPLAVPAAIVGATMPDWLEPVIGRLRGGQKPKHRGTTHHLTSWLLAAGFSLFVWDYNSWIFWLAIGGTVHWFCDAMTASGAPVGWWSDRRVCLLGGKVITGSASEYFITIGIVAVCGVLIWQQAAMRLDGQKLDEFLPFFYQWGDYYRSGLIDGAEWKTNRFKWF
jgi:inner membrane protein